MALESVTHIADLVRTNPTGGDPKSAGDDHIRNLKTSLLNDLVGFPGAIIVTGTDGGAADAYTLTPATGTLLAYSTKMLVEFTPTATNLTTTPTLNISALGAKTIKSVDNSALLANDLVAGTPVLATYDGTSVRLIGPTKNYLDQLALSAALPAQSLGILRSDGATAGFTQTTTGFALNAVKGADIASSGTINLTTATGEFVHVTGTTTITAITIPVGAERVVIFDGILTLTHGAALLLPGAANITTAANDRMIVRGDTAGAIVTSYTKASGNAVLETFALLGSATVGAAVANIDFLSSFSSTYDKYTIELEGALPTATANDLLMRMAVAGSANSGANYTTMGANGASVTAGQTSLTLAGNVSTSNGTTLTIEVRNANDTARYKWIGARGGYYTAAPFIDVVLKEGAYTGATALTGFRLFWSGGTTFAAGTVRVYGHRNT